MFNECGRIRSIYPIKHLKQLILKLITTRRLARTHLLEALEVEREDGGRRVDEHLLAGARVHRLLLTCRTQTATRRRIIRAEDTISQVGYTVN